MVSTRSANGVDAQNPRGRRPPGRQILLAWQALDGSDDRIEYTVGRAGAADPRPGRACRPAAWPRVPDHRGRGRLTRPRRS